ncbi:hypothetical protein [Phycisphaera mikurensis]|uniref:Uncharacterized protein n=1 Tax=Phycisphaera mikurensis (strain NBRC 102666 / KCTC 22515 / FYK2301M01) TaxID=1142394 RepID=I0ICB8_PHYMF|nr:hypothetical protein [Phycisphaera mikurensis]MBB6442217.1 hypothetical protein [Phycisphaera mikurensis]BAM02906.1 hypothetical protein PSMK_07470 [Phycisphaera mikurensis NBRC 102666]
MAHHAPALTAEDTAILGRRAWPWMRNLLIAGAACLGLALLLALLFGERGIQRFGFAYLIGYAFSMSIVLGCLFFTLITTLFRAGWCVTVRRLAEVFAASMPTMALLFLPILLYVASWQGALYPWAQTFEAPAGEHAMVSPDGPFRGGPFDAIQLAAAGARPVAGSPDAAGHGGQPATGVTPDGLEHADTPSHEAGQNPAGVVRQGMAEHAVGHAADAHHGEHHGPMGYSYVAEQNADMGWYDGALQYFTELKQPWFEPWFFVLRWILYFGVLGAIGYWFWRKSVAQDEDGDVAHTNRREWWAPVSVICFALLTMGVALDLLLGLDPVMFSTMFGVIFFADAFTAGLAVIILLATFLKKQGFLPNVKTAHFHDLTKLLFAFVFFWGYVSFSQFMLIWYASLPETTYWFELRGITTVQGTASDGGAGTYGGGWSWIALSMLFLHLLVPFAILLPAWTKRNPTTRTIMAVWLLVMVYVDFYWMAMPVLTSPGMDLGFLPIDLLVAVGLLALTVAAALRKAARHRLVAHRDPRMHEALALDTSVWAPMHRVEEHPHDPAAGGTAHGH